MSALAAFAAYLALSGVISYEDWTTRKVRNARILLGLAFCGALAGLLLLNSALGAARLRWGALGEYYLPLDFYPRLAAHLALSLAAAFALWRAAIWPAGDAKYFALSAFFAALVDPNLPGFPWLLFLLLLINVFVPAGTVFALETCALLLVRAARSRPGDWLKRVKGLGEVLRIRAREAWPYRRRYAVLALNLYALFLLVQLAAPRLARPLAEPWRSLLTFAVMFAVWGPLSSLLRDPRAGALALAGLCAAGAAAWNGPGVSLWGLARAALRMTLNFGVLLGLGRVALDWVIERESRRALRREELATGTILSDETWERLSGEGGLSGRLGARVADGLSGEEADAVRAWVEARGEGAHAVYRTIPFAFWIFLGCLVTLTARATVVALAAPAWARLKEAF